MVIDTDTVMNEVLENMSDSEAYDLIEKIVMSRTFTEDIEEASLEPGEATQSQMLQVFHYAITLNSKP